MSTPAKPVPERPTPRPLARLVQTVSATGRDETITIEVVVLDGDFPEDPDDPDRTSATFYDLAAIGIDRRGAGWRHYAAGGLQAYIRIVTDY